RRLRVVDGAAPAVTAVPVAPEPVALAEPVIAPQPVAVPEPLPEPAAATATPAPAAAAAAADDVTAAVVDIVSGLTGYPPELLDVDLDMEADLGVDTVKQAEVFAAVRERFNVARDDNLKLRDFPTLSHVIGWVTEKKAVSAPAEEPTPTQAPAPQQADDGIPRRVPVVALR